MKILIKGGRVVDPKNDFDKVADVLVDNGVISEIGENINADGDVTVIDAEGKIVSPGLVDITPLSTSTSATLSKSFLGSTTLPPLINIFIFFPFR